jgi:uncharacterized protein DUF5916
MVSSSNNNFDFMRAALATTVIFSHSYDLLGRPNPVSILLLVIAHPPMLVAGAARQAPASDTAAVAHRSPNGDRQLWIPQVANPPTLADIQDGKPSEATMITDFRQNQPGDGAPASLSTVAYLSYDDSNLSVIVDCRADPQHVRARLAKREDIGDDDQVLLYLDTFRDRRRAYVFSVNPLGVQRDGILTEGQGTDYDYDTVWRSEAKLTDQGFTIFITIPFSSLRFSTAAVQTWGIALGRYTPRVSEYSYWPYITKRVDGFVNQMAELDGIVGVSPGHNAQLIPYGAFTGSRYLDPSVPAFVNSREPRGGLDAKMALHDAMTLDVTLNPDFSQVESDEPQVTVNRRFEVFFPEKRPFFIENAGLFATPEDLVFSRRIADPQFGARLTGKAGGWAIGGLVTDDRAEGARFSTDSPYAGRRAAAAVVRVQRELGQESFVGILATSRDFTSSFDRVLAVDTRLKLNPNWIVTGQAIRSTDQALDGTRKDGSALNAALARSGRHFTYSGSYLERSPDFSAALGFIKRVDLRETDQSAAYYWRPTSGPLLAFGPALSTSVDWGYHGGLRDWLVQPELDLYFRRQYQINVWHAESYELFSGLGFRENNTTISLFSARSKHVTLSGSFGWGTSPNYSPAQGLAPFLADAVNASAGVTFRPAQRLRVDETYYYAHLGTRGGVTQNGSATGDIFTNHISRTKVNFQFTRALSVRASFDYNGILPDPQLIRQTLSKQVTGDILFTYLLNPFTALFIGYTDGHQNLEIDTSGPPTLRVTGSPSTLAARQVFLKLSYRIAL